MKKVLLCTCVSLILVLNGCQTNQQVSLKPEDMQPNRPASSPTSDENSTPAVEGGTTQTSSEKTAEPSVNPAPESSPEKIAQDKLDQSNKAAIRVPSVAKPGSDGWTKANLSVSEFAAKVDLALMNLKNVAGTFEMDLRNAEMEGTQSGEFLVADSKVFRVDFVDVDHPNGISRTVADGRQRTVRTYEGISKPTPVDAKGVALDTSAVSKFYRFYSKTAFETLTEKRPTWVPLLNTLSSQGYSSSLETKQLDSGGVMRPYFRLILSRKGGGLNEFEARFDGLRFVPLTMKMRAQDAKGRPITGEWRGAWHFEQQVRDLILKSVPSNQPKAP